MTVYDGARVNMVENEPPAGHLDVADKPRRGVDTRVLAHETDGAVAVDGDALDARDAGAKAVLHVSLLFRRPGLGAADACLGGHGKMP